MEGRLETVGERLEASLRQHGRDGMTRKALINALKGVEGASYPALRSYINGETEPSLTFLRQTAAILGVREAWLVTGEGPPGELDLHSEAGWVEDTGDPFPEWVNELEAALNTAGWELPWITHEMKGMFAQTVSELVESSPDYPHVELGLYSSVAKDLAWLVSLPLRSWGFQPPSAGKWLRSVVVLQLGALQLAVHEPRNGQIVGEYEGSLLPRLRAAD